MTEPTGMTELTRMTEPTGTVGFSAPIAEKTFSRSRSPIRRQILGIELFASVALVVCLIIALTAVSIGVARAQALAPAGGSRDDAPVAVAVFFGVMLASMGGLTAIVSQTGPAATSDSDEQD
jgi:hypothetical protein